MAVLQLVEVLAASANEGTVLSSGNVDTENNAVAQNSGGLLELGLDLLHEVGLATEPDLVGGLALSGAVWENRNISNLSHSTWERKLSLTNE